MIYFGLALNVVAVLMNIPHFHNPINAFWCGVSASTAAMCIVIAVGGAL